MLACDVGASAGRVATTFTPSAAGAGEGAVCRPSSQPAPSNATPTITAQTMFGRIFVLPAVPPA